MKTGFVGDVCRSAFSPKADIQLGLVQRAANDPKRLPMSYRTESDNYGDHHEQTENHPGDSSDFRSFEYGP